MLREPSPQGLAELPEVQLIPEGVLRREQFRGRTLQGAILAERRLWAPRHHQELLHSRAQLAPGNPAWELNGNRYHPVRQFHRIAVFPRHHKNGKVREAEAV